MVESNNDKSLFGYVNDIFKDIEYVDGDSKVYYDISVLSRDELVDTFLEIQPMNTDDFLKVKETLTRIGIANRTDKVLYQSCLLLHKKGRFYICHFKELFAMDEKDTKMYREDYARRNHVAHLLEQWNLVNIINKDIAHIPSEAGSPVNVYVLSHKNKVDWKLVSKYAIGTVPKIMNKKERIDYV